MKCFNNALVYVEGKGLIKRSIEFDQKIKKICKKSKAEEIIFSDSKWANALFDVKNHSKLLSVWMTCLPIPIVLEGCCKGYSRDFLKKSVQKIHSMFWNGILYKNKENKNEDEIKN